MTTFITSPATADRQDAGNSSLASIDAKIITVNTGAISFSAPQHVIIDNTVTVTGSVAILGNVEVVNDVGNPLPINGSVTANAGINLNTSLLALEAGGNLAAIKTDVDKIPADPARESGHLTTIDSTLSTQLDSKTSLLATQATLALIKAKTDNLDTLLSSINTQYSDGSDESTGIGTIGMALADDAPPVRLSGKLYPISITNDGSLRVSSVPARSSVEFFSDKEESMWGNMEQEFEVFEGSPWS